MDKPYVDHVSFVVEDLDKAIKMFGALWSMEPDEVVVKEAIGLKIANFEAANVTLELIQFIGPSSFEKVLGTEPGINHLGLRIKDMEPALADLSAAGVELLPGFPVPGSRGPIAFVDTDTAQAMRLELCEVKDE